MSHAYHKGDPVLRGVSLSVAPGRVTALVGPNGSGKSTLLRLLAGIARPDAGTVTLAGEPVGAWSAAARARRLALMPQRPEVAFGYTVREVVAFGRLSRARVEAPSDGGPGESAVDRALARVGLRDRAGDRFEHLSVGQQQRGALARALAQLDAGEGEPTRGVLLADEPVSAMDPRHAIESLSLLRACAREGHAVLVVLHDLNHALRFADDAAVLGEGGTIAASGRAADCLRPEVLNAVFGVAFASLADPAGGTILVARDAPVGR